MQKITPFLWFDAKAEEAANFYVSIFRNSRLEAIRRWGAGGPAPAGAVMSATFEIEGRSFIEIIPRALGEALQRAVA